MNAKITIEFTANNLCDEDDFGPNRPDKTFRKLAMRLIRSEGLFGIVEDRYKIISIIPEP